MVRPASEEAMSSARKDWHASAVSSFREEEASFRRKKIRFETEIGETENRMNAEIRPQWKNRGRKTCSKVN